MGHVHRHRQNAMPQMVAVLVKLDVLMVLVLMMRVFVHHNPTQTMQTPAHPVPHTNVQTGSVCRRHLHVHRLKTKIQLLRAQLQLQFAALMGSVANQPNSAPSSNHARPKLNVVMMVSVVILNPTLISVQMCLIVHWVRLDANNKISQALPFSMVFVLSLVNVLPSTVAKLKVLPPYYAVHRMGDV